MSEDPFIHKPRGIFYQRLEIHIIQDIFVYNCLY